MALCVVNCIDCRRWSRWHIHQHVVCHSDSCESNVKQWDTHRFPLNGSSEQTTLSKESWLNGRALHHYSKVPLDYAMHGNVLRLGHISSSLLLE